MDVPGFSPRDNEVTPLYFQVRMVYDGRGTWQRSCAPTGVVLGGTAHALG